MALKKLGEDLRQARLVAKRTGRSLASRKRRRIRQAEARDPLYPRARKARSGAKQLSVSRRELIIAAPRVFSITVTEAREEVLAFLGQLRKATLVARRRVLIDFTHTMKMYPEGTLLLAAELDRINRATAPRSLIRCRHPDDDIVGQVLQHLGLFAKMRANRQRPVSADNVRHWRLADGTDVDGERAGPVLEEYERLFSSEEATRLYKGLTEAMTNSKHHAYTGERFDGMAIGPDHRWWLLCQEREGRLFVAFCDLGIGINRSLQEGDAWPVEQVMAFVEKLGGTLLRGKLRWARHSTFIKAAVELGKTKTRLPHRGKGLQDIKAVFEHIPTGWLRILSNRGMYTYEAQTSVETLADFRTSIYGTLIAWLIPLPEGGADDKI